MMQHELHDRPVLRMTETDLCAQEPIHIPAAIQPHGALVCASSDGLRVLQASGNAAAMLGVDLQPGMKLDFDPVLATQLAAWSATGSAFHRGLVRRGAQLFQLSAHRTHQGLLLEFEASADEAGTGQDQAYEELRQFISQIEALADLQAVSRFVVRHLRALTGFNRTLIYRFGADWNGTVIAEDGDGALPSYLDLRFPASDIPAQARALYQRNRLRLIPDADYVPVPINPPLSPVDGQPLDMTPVALRAVSPIHLRYMRNMATQASMSIALVAEGRLWGLISCHHRTARNVGPRLRAACDLLGQLAAQQIVTRERMSEIGQRITLKRVETDVLGSLARASAFQDGLSENLQSWLALTNSAGVAVVFGGDVHLAGVTPSAPQVKDIAAWLQTGANLPVFATDWLAGACPAAENFAAEASGLLAASISQIHPGYIMWFRPELIHTVSWAGDPAKPTDPDRLAPRTSFDQWKELVRHHAAPWHSAEIDAAADFRNAVVDFVLRHAEERAAITEKLQLSNRELEAFSYSVSHDLRAPFRHIVGYAQLLRDREGNLDPTSGRFLDTIRDAALSAGRLVDDLLAFSQLSRASMAQGRIDMNKLVAEARTMALVDVKDRAIDWQIGKLPEIWGDATMLRQAVLNLLSNAVKYSGPRDIAEIAIMGYETDTETVLIIRDNGIGFDMRYVGKLFGVFQRLHRVEDFEGTGIGLALTKRIIDRHGGWIKAEGMENQGATFTFALPRQTVETPLA
jgi:two-component system, chemotaxis family, sensor kinase Cph1